ncbi:MAG: type II toxin-antitoxin system RelE/ParE family toxin [Vicingaceae bacterium]
MGKLEVVWTNQAKNSLKAIYDYYKEKSLQGAKKVKNDLLQSPKTIYYSIQYQIDEINSIYRRKVVRVFKVLYKESKNKIEIIDIVSSKRSPTILKKR